MNCMNIFQLCKATLEKDTLFPGEETKGEDPKQEDRDPKYSTLVVKRN